MFCLTCGGEIKLGSKFCPRCGVEVKNPQQPVNQVKAASPQQAIAKGIPNSPVVEKPDLGGPDTSAIIAAYRKQTNIQGGKVGGKFQDPNKELFYAYAQTNGEELYRKCYDQGHIHFSVAALFFGQVMFLYRRNYIGFIAIFLLNMIVLRFLPIILTPLLGIAYGFMYYPMMRIAFENAIAKVTQAHPEATTEEISIAIEGKGSPNILGVCLFLIPLMILYSLLIIVVVNFR